MEFNGLHNAQTCLPDDSRNLCFVLEIGSSGEELKIHNISRYCEDVYECVADNGIGTEAKREMKVTVQCKKSP